MAVFTFIGTAIAGALFGGSLMAASLISGALAFGASLATSYLGRQKQQKRAYTAVQGETKYGGDIDVETLYGVGKTKGQRSYYAKWGAGNKFNAEVFLLSNGWCDGLELYCYFYGKRHTLIEATKIGDEVAHYKVDGYGNTISIRFYDGRPGQKVDAKLVSDTASLGNSWKSTSVNAGICYVIVERQYDAALFEKGRPEFDFVLRGLREYDPRKDSTVAGGSGSQRINDPSTWLFTRNPAVHRLNYQLGLKAMISGRTLIGEGKSLGQLDLGTYIAAMNVCDSIRNGAPTYQCNLWVNGSDDHTEVLKEFDDAMAGYGLNRRGLSGVIAGAPQIPVLEITADDIDVGRDSEVQYRKSAFERYNHLSGQYISIDNDWQPESLTPVYVNADTAADGRNRQIKNDFLQVTDPDIAQYLLTIRYRQNRLGGSATLPVSLRVGLAVQEGEWVTWNGRDWMVSEWQCDEQFNVTLVLTETSADIYDDEDIEAGPVIIPPTPPVNPSITTTVEGFSVETGLIEGADGFQTPFLQFAWDAPDDPTIIEIVFEYRITGQSEVFSDVCRSPELGIFQTSKDVVSGVYYQARATIRTVPARFTTWTVWTSTPAKTEDQTVKANAYLANIQDDAKNVLRNLRRDIDGLRLIIEGIATDLPLVGAIGESNRRLLSADLGSANASVVQVQEAFVNFEAAFARQLEAVVASLGDVIAEGYLSMVARTDGDLLSQVEIAARAQKGEPAALAALILRVINDDDVLKSQLILNANQLIFTDDSGEETHQPFVIEDGVLKGNIGHFGTIFTGMIGGPDSKLQIDVTNGTFVVRT